MKLSSVVFTAALLVIAGCEGAPSGEDANEAVIYAVMPSKIQGFDPGYTSGIYSAQVASEIFECLYQYHYLKRPYKLIPQLAEGMPEVSRDNLTYTIRIKKGIYFADDKCFADGKGRELKASDFVFAWKRIANIKYLSPNWWIFEHKILGLDEFREYTKSCKGQFDVDYSLGIEGLETPDDYTIVIRLKKPWPQIMYLLAFPPTAPIAKEAVDYYGKDIIRHPVGTGPFKLNVWNRGSYIELVKNPNFREEYYPSEGEEGDRENGFLADAGKRLPLVDKISWLIIEEEQPMWLQFLRGKLDASAIPKDSFGNAISPSRELTSDMKERNIRLVKIHDPDTYFIGFNMEDPVLGNNKPLRQAISCGYNRAGETELFWNNAWDVAYGFIPPMFEAYNPKIKEIGQRYDPEKANQLLKQAEKIYGGKLPKLRLTIGATDTQSRQLGQYNKRCLEEIGLEIELEFMDWPIFMEKLNTKSCQIFSVGWMADYPDTETFLQVFYSKNASPGPNHYNYSSKKFDEIYEKAVVMPNSPERTELYRQAEQTVLEDCPAVCALHRVRYILCHDWLGNYKGHVFPYGVWKYRKVDVTKRAAYKELLKKG
ncbi:MAG: ABC transporter substrate-binding protein [Phycisphaerae bacterium]|nr:ABC transporter substrate-binding protein [Phycisphaerae bacterium]